MPSRPILDPDAALKLDTSITGDILTLRQTLSAGDYAAADSDLAALKAAVLKRDHAYTSQEEIQSQVKSVESELAQLKSSLSGAVHVTAKSAGTYSAVCDGYETVLTPALLEGLTPPGCPPSGPPPATAAWASSFTATRGTTP